MYALTMRCRTIGLLGLLLLAAGCDSGEGSLAPVRGTVFYGGVPLRRGTIVFTPDALRGSDGSLARADIQADGTYCLQTGDTHGAPIGWHRVTIVALEDAPAPAAEHSFVIPRSLVPDKYGDPELSGLTCEIKAGQENVIDFHLE